MFQIFLIIFGLTKGQNCSITEALAGGIPDIPITAGGWDDYLLTGAARSSLTQKAPSSNKLSKIHDGISYGGYSLGSYSHTLDGVSYYTNGDIDGCRRPRESKIRWKCGNRHMQIVSGWEPAICQYEFVMEINCCQDEQSHLAGTYICSRIF